MSPEVLDLINPDVSKKADDLRRSFESNRPFPHLVLEDFLAQDFCSELLAEFPPFNTRKALNEFGEVGLKATVENIRSLAPVYGRFDDLVSSPAFLKLMGRITDIPDLVHDPGYFGGGTHENLTGQNLDLHVDFNYHPETGRHRRLNMIVFLNREWDREWGGSLRLQYNPWVPPQETESVEVLPVFNRCVLFETSEESWHGFDVIRIPPEKAAEGVSRRSLSVYFYSDERPQEETAPEHSTVYVPSPLPASLLAGLSEEDAAEIQELVSRRDKQIRFLYHREKEWSAERSRLPEEMRRLKQQTGRLEQERQMLKQWIGEIERSPSFRLARALTWPLRKLLRR